MERERRTSDSPRQVRRLAVFLGIPLIVGCVLLGLFKGGAIGFRAAFPYVHFQAPASR